MPVIKSAKKKLRQDKKRTLQNRKLKEDLKDTLKKAQNSRKKEDIIAAFSLADKAAKKNIIHNNKASRIKSRLSKLIKPEGSKTPTPSKKPASKSPKKTQK